jgi:hypothetical protein
MMTKMMSRMVPIDMALSPQFDCIRHVNEGASRLLRRPRPRHLASHDRAERAQSWVSIRRQATTSSVRRMSVMSAMAAATAVAATVAATAAVTNRRSRMTAATAVTDRGMCMAGMTDRRMGVASMTDGRVRVTAMSDRGVRMTRMAAAGMSAMPMMPAIAAAPADAGTEILTAPVPAWAIPAVVVPAIIATEPDELRALDHVQAVGGIADRGWCDRWSGVGAGAYYRHTGNKHGRDRKRAGDSTHDNLPKLDFPIHTLRELPEWR